MSSTLQFLHFIQSVHKLSWFVVAETKVLDWLCLVKLSRLNNCIYLKDYLSTKINIISLEQEEDKCKYQPSCIPDGVAPSVADPSPANSRTGTDTCPISHGHPIGFGCIDNRRIFVTRQNHLFAILQVT